MKNFKVFISFLISVSIVGVSVSNEKADIKTKIEKLIEEVKKAPPSEKYKKMNQLKLFIKKLKAKERIKIMKKLHKQLKGQKQAAEHKHRLQHRLRKGKIFNKEHFETRNLKENCKEKIKKEGHQFHFRHGNREIKGIDEGNHFQDKFQNKFRDTFNDKNDLKNENRFNKKPDTFHNKNKQRKFNQERQGKFRLKE